MQQQQTVWLMASINYPDGNKLLHGPFFINPGFWDSTTDILQEDGKSSVRAHENNFVFPTSVISSWKRGKLRVILHDVQSQEGIK